MIVLYKQMDLSLMYGNPATQLEPKISPVLIVGKKVCDHYGI